MRVSVTAGASVTPEQVLGGIAKFFAGIGSYLHERHVRLTAWIAAYPGYTARMLELLLLVCIVVALWKVLRLGSRAPGKKLAELTKKKGFWITVGVVLLLVIVIIFI